MSAGSFRNVIYKMCLEIIYLIYTIYDLALNSQQWLICHKPKPNQILFIQYICIKKVWH